MYHKYNTEGIVIRSRERGEASRAVTILTEEFGVIHASVQNARAMNSKLRQGVQDLSLCNFTLLKGRHDWKVVGTQVQKNFFYSMSDKQKRMTTSRILNLILNLVGEEKNIELYAVLLETLNSLESCTPEDIEIIERFSVLRLLKNQGLVAERDENLEPLAKDKSDAIRTINIALKAAHIV